MERMRRMPRLPYLLEVPVAQTASTVPSSCSCTEGRRSTADGVFGFTPSIHSLMRVDICKIGQPAADPDQRIQILLRHDNVARPKSCCMPRCRLTRCRLPSSARKFINFPRQALPTSHSTLAESHLISEISSSGMLGGGRAPPPS